MIYNFESDKNKNSRVESLVKDKAFYKKSDQTIKSRESMVLSKESKISAISKENFMKYLMKIKNHLPLKMSYWQYFKSFFL